MNIKTIGTWVLTVLLTLAFLGAGLSKVSAQPMMVAEFGAFGYPLWFMYVTGVLEIVAAIVILIPKYAFFGAALLVCIMVGAIFSHVTHGQAAMIAAPVVLLLLSLLLANLRKPVRA